MAGGGVFGDNVGFGAYYVEDHVAGEVASELSEPGAHLEEGVGVGDGVAKDTGVGAAVVETGYRSEAFLTGYS